MSNIISIECPICDGYGIIEDGEVYDPDCFGCGGVGEITAEEAEEWKGIK